MEEKITLDRDTFKTLASDTRVGILKSLSRRRKMLTELSKESGMSPSTIKEHLDNLVKAELVVQKDDGHKWKYYELTRKGKNVLAPGENRIWIILSLSAMAIMVTGYDFLQQAMSMSGTFTRSEDMILGEAAPQMMVTAGQGIFIPYWHVLAFVVFSVMLGISLGYLLGKKRFYSFQGE